MESFHSVLENNVLDTKKWETRKELRMAIVTWIERTYHRRRKCVLGKNAPSNVKPRFKPLMKYLSRRETMETLNRSQRQPYEECRIIRPNANTKLGIFWFFTDNEYCFRHRWIPS